MSWGLCGTRTVKDYHHSSSRPHLLRSHISVIDPLRFHCRVWLKAVGMI